MEGADAVPDVILTLQIPESAFVHIARHELALAGGTGSWAIASMASTRGLGCGSTFNDNDNYMHTLACRVCPRARLAADD